MKFPTFPEDEIKRVSFNILELQVSNLMHLFNPKIKIDPINCKLTRIIGILTGQDKFNSYSL